MAIAVDWDLRKTTNQTKQTLAWKNSEDPDLMAHKAPFHQGIALFANIRRSLET